MGTRRDVPSRRSAPSGHVATTTLQKGPFSRCQKVPFLLAISIFKHGTALHCNTFELGQHGRYRTNVWSYRDAPAQRAARAWHPTVKPVSLIADALRDVSGRGEIVLDGFGGSGSTLIAAEKTGRRARLCEIDSVYCDRILARWETYATDDATRLEAGGPAAAEHQEVAP